MWTRGKDKENEGKFRFQIFDSNNDLVKNVGGFDCPLEADRAAEMAHRVYLRDIGIFGRPMDDEGPAYLDDISDEELLALLAA